MAGNKPTNQTDTKQLGLIPEIFSKPFEWTS